MGLDVGTVRGAGEGTEPSIDCCSASMVVVLVFDTEVFAQADSSPGRTWPTDDKETLIGV